MSLLMAYNMNEKNHQNLQYLDTGYNNHMSRDKLIFSYLFKSYQDFIKFDDESKVPIMEKGMVAIQTIKNTTIPFDVFFVLELKKKIIQHWST